MSDAQKLYIIQHIDRESLIDAETAGKHKIGISTNPKQRRKNLAGGTPHELRLLTTCGIEGDAESVESKLHQLFFTSLYAKEWFRLGPDALRVFKETDSISEAALDEVRRKFWIIRSETNPLETPPAFEIRDSLLEYEVLG